MPLVITAATLVLGAVWAAVSFVYKERILQLVESRDAWREEAKRWQDVCQMLHERVEFDDGDADPPSEDFHQ